MSTTEQGQGMGAFFWVLGGLVVLVGAVVLRDKSTRRKVIRAMARSWERRQRRSGGRAKAKARQHIRTAKRATAKSLPQANPTYHRPRKPKILATKCSAACRTSRKPAYDKNGVLTCDCPCGGREHGMYRKGQTAQTRAATKQAVGSNGAKKASTPKPAAPKPAPAQVASKSAPVQVAAKAPAATMTKPRPAAPRAGTPKVQPKAGPKGAKPPLSGIRFDQPPPGARDWRDTHPRNRLRIKTHTELSPDCRNALFAVRTVRDRRTDPPKITQKVVCGTCKEEL